MRAQPFIATIVSCAALLVGAAHAEAPEQTPSADAIFSAAKGVWRARHEAPYVAFNLRERYEWRGRTHDNWWRVAYRDTDRALALQRIIVASDERERLKGTPIRLNIRFKSNNAKADSFDTNPSADAFPILDPQIEPNASFGLLRRERKLALVGTATARPDATAPLTAVTPMATPVALSTPAAPLAPAALLATEQPLRELARVEAVARDYTIVFAGTERVRGTETYHLALTPLRSPRVYRLRDLWVDTQSNATVQLSVQGLFEGKPYDDARWTVAFVTLGGSPYVQQIRTDDALRFGLDRVVTGMEFDFVAYDFPTAMPAMTFEHLL